MTETRPDPDTPASRPCYEPRLIRAADLEPEDVALHDNRWRYVTNMYRSDTLDDENYIHKYDLSNAEVALFRAYLVADQAHVIAQLRIDGPGTLTPAHIYVPYGYYELVTIQHQTGTIPQPN